MVVVVRGLEDEVRGLGLLAAGGLEELLAGGGETTGRGRNRIVALPGRRERLHLRAVRHGGWLARALSDRVLGLQRPLDELAATARLSAAGAPVARPALVAGRRRLGPLWQAAVGTLYEEDTLDGAAFLAARPSPERVLLAARAVGAALRRFHDAGGRHADLHVGNLLLRTRGAGYEALLVDLDRARVAATVSPSARMAELMRLHRSLVKRHLLERAGARGCAALFSAYTAGDRGLRRALLAHLPRERLRLALHRLAYR